MENKEKQVTIKGLIAPSNWDKKDNVVGVKIHTHGEQDFVVQGDEKGTELLRHVREFVKVTGTLKGDVKGEKVIAVQKYEVLHEW